MISDLIIFFTLAVVAVGSALGLLFSKNAIYAALNLIINFVTVAVYYLLLGAPFIALSQITVYAGAIMVLFLFVIMLLGAERLPGSSTLPWQRPLALTLAVLLVLELVYILVFHSETILQVAPAGASFGSPTAIGLTLFNSYLLPFETVSILLLVAMIGAIVLTKKRISKT